MLTAKTVSTAIAFVIAVFDSGEFTGFWNIDDEDFDNQTEDATWFESRPEAVEQLGEIPRKIDARIYELVPSPEPNIRTDEPIGGGDLPEFLKKKEGQKPVESK